MVMKWKYKKHVRKSSKRCWQTNFRKNNCQGKVILVFVKYRKTKELMELPQSDKIC